jgi:uncharacterized protein (TIGR02145 family)
MISYTSQVDSQRNNAVVEKYCYNNNSLKCDTFGALYQWAEAVQYQNGAKNTALTSPTLSGNIRGICPLGWHLPSEAEFATLEIIWGGSSGAGGHMKSTGSFWASPNTGATNLTGFSALPTGMLTNTFNNQYVITFYWSSTEFSATQSKVRTLGYNSATLGAQNSTKIYGNAVRCLKD